MAQINGTTRNDNLFGSAEDDLINGGAGNDTLRGFTGADVMHGDAGADKLYAYLGNAVVDGGADVDWAAIDLRGHNGPINFSIADNLAGVATVAGLQISNIESVTLYTGRGETRLEGGAGNDTFVAEGGFNIMFGRGGNDRLEGGDGFDYLAGGAGNDVLLGGAGDDFLLSAAAPGDSGNMGVDVLDGGAGTDRAVIDRSTATAKIRFDLSDPGQRQMLDNGTTVINVEGVSLTTGKGADTLIGGNYGDYFNAGAGNDVIMGGGASDELHGGAGNDIIFAGANIVSNHDSLFGEDGNDILHGGLGNAVIDGGAGKDHGHLDFSGYNGNVTFSVADNLAGAVTLAGVEIRNLESVSLHTGRGDAVLTGGAGDDLLQADGGFNVLNGGAGNDMLLGGDGTDILYLGMGADIANGGAGDDVIIAQLTGADDLGKNPGIDQIDGGAGYDTAFVDRSAASGAITADFSNASVRQVLDNGASIVNVEAITLKTGRGNDKLTGGDYGDRFYAGKGDDVVDGRGGDDELHGEGGDDYLDGGAGADILQGGSGDDTLNAQRGDKLVDGGDGRDFAWLDFSASNTGVKFSVAENLAGAVTVDGVEIRNLEQVNIVTGRGDNDLTGGAYDDSFTSSGGFNVMRGMGGADRLQGGGDTDILDGGSGNDFLFGGAGDDVLISGAGIDVLDGGAGYDHAAIDRSGATSGISFSLAQPSTIQYLDNGGSVVNVEQVSLTTGRGADVLYGGKGADFFDGGSGDDDIDGALGDDDLHGGRGDDILIGGAGADLIDGGDGDDNINGGLGDRSIDGGKGVDTAYLDFRGHNGNVQFKVADNLAGVMNVAGTQITRIEQVVIETGAGDDVLVGGSLDDIFTSTGGTNHMDGAGGDDLLMGGDGLDILWGGSGDDRLRGGGESDILDGGKGNDVALYLGASTDYLVTKTATGFLVRDLDPSGRDGIDHLVSVESLQFSDGVFTPAELVARGIPPVAVADTIMTTENLSGAVNVLANDQDRTGGGLKLVSVTSADPHLTLGFSANGDVSVTPGAGYQFLPAGQSATATATYVVENATGQKATGSIAITITGENDVPIALADAFSVNEDTSLINLNLVGNDSDVDAGAQLAVAGLDLTGTAGAVTLNPNGTVSYDPGAAFQHLAAGQTATDTFSYSVRDQFGVGTSATVTITITGADEPPAPAGPTARDDLLTLDAAQHAVKLSDLLDNDSGVGLHLVEAPEFSEAGATLTIGADGSLIYDPQTVFNGLGVDQVATDGFDYTVEDANGHRSTAHATITVTGGHDRIMSVYVAEDASTGNLSAQLMSALHGKYGFGLSGIAFDTSHTVGSFTADANQISYVADDAFFDPLVGDTKVLTSVGVSLLDAQGDAHHSYLLLQIDGVTDLIASDFGPSALDLGYFM